MLYLTTCVWVYSASSLDWFWHGTTPSHWKTLLSFSIKKSCESPSIRCSILLELMWIRIRMIRYIFFHWLTTYPVSLFRFKTVPFHENFRFSCFRRNILHCINRQKLAILIFQVLFDLFIDLKMIVSEQFRASPMNLENIPGQEVFDLENIFRLAFDNSKRPRPIQAKISYHVSLEKY